MAKYVLVNKNRSTVLSAPIDNINEVVYNPEYHILMKLTPVEVVEDIELVTTKKRVWKIKDDA